MENARAYPVALQFCVAGIVVLSVLTVFYPGQQHIFLILTFLWAVAAVFLFPWCYVCLHEGEIKLPPWLYRGLP